MSANDRKVIQVSKPIHERLIEIQQENEERLGRQVTFSEIIERLLERVEAA